MSPELAVWWQRLDCRFKKVADVFADCLSGPMSRWDEAQLTHYIDSARLLGKLGRGPEPLLAFLESWPEVADTAGAALLPELMARLMRLQRSPNGRAIAPLLQSLGPVARRLRCADSVRGFLDIVDQIAAATTLSIHGHHATEPSPGLPVFLGQAPLVLQSLSLTGLHAWVVYGLRNYADHPERQCQYFSLALPDSLAVLQRERSGTLLVDVERSLTLGFRALWEEAVTLVPMSTLGQSEVPAPRYEGALIQLPDVYPDDGETSGLARYRLAMAHMAGHRRWSAPLVADNWSPMQRLAVEFFEDARVDTLLLRNYPGLRKSLLALHPVPEPVACDPDRVSCLRHRLAMFSRAVLDPEYRHDSAVIGEFAERLLSSLNQGESTTRDTATLALDFVRQTRRQSDQYAEVHFTDTLVSYRDDNRHLWRFIEAGDEEESFDKYHRAELDEELTSLPPHHYPEWDVQTKTYHPDWVSLYEALHPAGDPTHIDRLLARHASLSRRLKQMLEAVKPQDRARIRYQEDGSELDLDVAVRSLIDLRSGVMPDMRITQSHRTDGRDIAVLVLLDLSESLKAVVPGTSQTILELSQEAVSLLGWAVDCLGDPFAIAGFHSNTRHEVRYHHIKGFGERWDDTIKARLAAMAPAWSTRMGAALRHGGNYLAQRRADKRIVLLLTDGEPADVDVNDPAHLRADARKAVEELAAKGVDVFCLSLDAAADNYVKEIFGQRWQVLDRIDRLPAALTELYLRLTR